jgi:SAM-dependent methyltransferase
MTKKGLSVRNKRVIKMINLDNQVGLEIGPLTSPVVNKSNGHIYYIDHMSQEELKEKYKNEPVNLDEIVPIDFVLKNNSIEQAINGKKFDYVIASHVIEHIPDTVSWLKDISSVLRSGGILSLVIPDKRFTFDIFRQSTKPSEVIGAYIDKTTKPTSAMIYDYGSKYAKDIDTVSVWNDRDYYTKRPPTLRWTEQEAIDMCEVNALPEGYIDCHCHVYTPESFLAIIKELTKHKLIDFEICSFLETQNYGLEFFVSLKKTQITNKNMKSILNKIPNIKDYDIREQERMILQKENKKLLSEVSSLTNSTSWKITQPLRSVNKLRKRT